MPETPSPAGSRPVSPAWNAGSRLEIDPETLERNLIVGFSSHDGRSRPFNLLRSQITRHIDQTGSRLLGVTSATPAAGKSFVSANLAAALSQIEGHSVILCDFDLRRGSVLDIFEAQAPVDLGAFLKGEIPDWTTALYRVGESNLYLLPSEPSPLGSSELLSGSRFGDLIDGLRALPDEFIVLCDLPPAFANDDAMLCVDKLDGFLLVVEHGRTTAAQVKETLNLLEPKPCVGTILNRYQGGFADDYGYGYGDPYGLKSYGQTK